METINIEINTGNSLKSIKEMRNELKELRGQMANAEGQEFQNLSVKASELNAKLDRTNSTITSSDSSFTNFNTILGRTSKSLLTLDFGAAAEQATALQNVAKKMTFKELSSGIRDASKAFKIMGKALLTNPFFLLAAIVIGIVAAFYSMREEIAILDPVLNALGQWIDILLIPIKLLIDGLNSLTDWLGLTDSSANDAIKGLQGLNEVAEETHKITKNRFTEEIGWLELKADKTEEDYARLKQLKLDEAKTEVEFLMQKTINSAKEVALLLKTGKIKSEDAKERIAEIEQMRHETILSYQALLKLEQELNKPTKSGGNGGKSKKEANEEEKIDTEKTKKFIEDLKRKEKLQEIDAIEDTITRNKTLQLQKLEWAKADTNFAKMGPEAVIKWKEWEEQEKIRIDNEAITAEQKREEDRVLKIGELQKQLDNLKRGEETFEEKEARLLEEHNTELLRLQTEYDGKVELHEEYLLKKQIAEQTYINNLAKIEDDRIKKELNDKAKVAKSEQELANVKKGILKDSISGMKSFAGENEKMANGVLAVQKGLAAGELIADSIKRGGILKGQFVAGKALLGTPAAPAGVKMMAGAAVGLAGLGISTAAGLAGIAGISLKSGGGSTPSSTGGGDGGSTPIMQTSNFQPSFSNFNSELGGDIQGGQSAQPTFITDKELANNNERMAYLNNRRDF